MAPFGYRLTRVESFPTVAWLAPEPAAPFLELIARTSEAFPDHPPYGDPRSSPCRTARSASSTRPRGLQAVLEELRAGLGPLLPIRCEARAATLLEERDDRTWAVHTRFPFEGAG